MKISSITVTTCPAELKADDKWDEACEYLGLHPEIADEMRPEAPIVLDEQQARDLGLLT